MAESIYKIIISRNGALRDFEKKMVQVREMEAALLEALIKAAPEGAIRSYVEEMRFGILPTLMAYGTTDFKINFGDDPGLGANPEEVRKNLSRLASAWEPFKIRIKPDKHPEDHRMEVTFFADLS